MRLVAPFGCATLALLLLTACQAEPDFDERYADAEQQIRTKAQEIDAQLEDASARGERPAMVNEGDRAVR